MAHPLAAFREKTVVDPYPTYKWLRENDPLCFNENSNEWLLSRYEDVYDALRNHTTYSSSAMAGAGGQGFPLISDDPPRHSRLRSLVNRAFTPTVIKRLEPFVRATALEFVEAFPAGKVDLTEALTVPFPIIVIARMLGVPDKDRELFKLWSDALTGLLDGDVGAKSGETIMQMYPYFLKEIEKRRSEPMDDLISAVADAEVDGEKLNDQEIIGFVLLLLVAGNETTTNLVGNMLNALAERPEMWARLREDRSLTETAVEETLRFDSPVQFIYRKVVQEVELHGKRLEPGARVLIGFASANRDPANFNNPDEFSLDRDLKRHLAFGHGIHFCLGAPLARLEGKLALELLLDRYESVRHAGESVRLPSHLLRGFHHLPLEFQ